MNYTDHYSTRKTSQSEPIPGESMVQNDAGGYVYQLSHWDQLERFLILGSEGGTYYASEHDLTVDNAKNVLVCIREDSQRVVDRVLDISCNGRAPKNDPALFVLAMVSAFGDVHCAMDALPRVARTGTHLFNFAGMMMALRGWGRSVRNGVSRWYTEKSLDKLAYQLVKYRQRNGWTHRDVLRLAHPKPDTPELNNLFAWATGHMYDDNLPSIILACERAMECGDKDKKEIISLIEEHNLTREMIPTEYLSDPDVQWALMQRQPLTALLRNLANYTKSGLLQEGSFEPIELVEKKLTDMDYLKKSRVHPMHILTALATYKKGRNFRGDSRWTPVGRVLDILDAAFYASFGLVVPTNKKTLIGLDVSGSMGFHVNGVLSAYEIAGAMSLVQYRTEPMCAMVAFSHELIPIAPSKHSRLDSWIEAMMNISFGGTDCSLPILYAKERNLEFDVFQVWTDNQTWAGSIHPSQALRDYRNKTGTPSKLIVAGVTSSGFSIADPEDRGMLDIVGFDSAVPSIIHNFVVE